MDNQENINPLVAIQCITYNHEPYIRDALEGFVMQKTNFPFVAIVHDDASTDKTAEIIREYAEKYPDIIKPIYETENQYSKKDGTLTRIMNAASEATGAKYIALCEGDDYWTDPLKLQKQVDFLESHPDYSMCFHGVNIKIEKGCNLSSSEFQQLVTKDYSGPEILATWTIPTCSVVLYTNILKNRPINSKFVYGDNVIWLTCARYGKIRGMEEKMATYRRSPTGWMAQNNMILVKSHLNHILGLKESFPELPQKTYDILLANVILTWFILNIKSLKSIKDPIREAKDIFGKQYLTILLKQLLINFKKKYI